jgi:hypothetical protein
VGSEPVPVLKTAVARAGALSLALMLLSGCASSSTAKSPAAQRCVPVSRIERHGRLLSAGASLQVRPGALVYVVLALAGKYASPGYPRSFPWQAPQVSDRHVLSPLRPCAPRGATTERLSLSAYRAGRSGKATVTAGLAPSWKNLARAPRPYRASVTVLSQ